MTKYIVLLILILNSFPALSAITIELQDVIYQGIQVDTREMPIFKATIRAKKDGKDITLAPWKIVIIENTWSSQAISAIPIADGFYEVRWKSRPKGYLGYNIAEIVITEENEVGYAQAAYLGFYYPKVLIKNQLGQGIEEQHFGSVPANIETLRQVKVHALKGKIDGEGLEKPIQIDSITLGSSVFRYNWQGNEIDQTPPPVKSMIGSFNLVDLYFKANTDEFYNDFFTVHYEKGFTESLYLTVNKFPIEFNTVMKLIQPNGGEILSPCEDYEVKWRNHLREKPVKVFFSSNDGFKWEEVGSSNDSTFMWRVPVNYTDFGRIKIKQDFASTGRSYLPGGNAPVRKIAFSSNGFNLISVNDSLNIYEFDPATKTLKSSYFVNQGNLFNQSTGVFGISYFKGDSSFVIAYDYNWGNGDKQDSLAFFKIGNPNPIKKVAIPADFSTKRMFVDSKRETIVLLPNLGNELLLLKATDGSIIRRQSYPQPVYSMALSPSTGLAVIYLINGELRIADINDLDNYQKIDLPYLPLVTELGISPNDQYLALGCKAPLPTPTSVANTEIHVMHLGLKKIVRTIRNTASDPVGVEFNPASTVLVIGSKAQPQIAFWDLVTGDYIGSLGGSADLLTDIRFSPEGHSVAVSTAGPENLIIQNFSYPEEVISASAFRIVEPKIEIKNIALIDSYIGEYKEFELNSSLCNTGESNITFTSAAFRNGAHFRLFRDFVIDTLIPGECLSLRYIYQPLDTGLVRDTLVLTSKCLGDYLIPIESYSKGRTLTFINPSIDFGEKCLGQNHSAEFAIIRNDDPVPVLINSIEFSDVPTVTFNTATSIKDTILNPGETLRVRLIFYPGETKEYIGKLRIYHSLQRKHFAETQIRGKGIGTFLNQSHTRLLFIPEILNRKIVIKNQGDNRVEITEANISPTGNFTILTPLPFFINPSGEGEIEVLWNGQTREDAQLIIKAAPCISNMTIELGFYEAASTVIIPNVEADPIQEISIPVNYSNNENGDYAGVRPFRIEFSVNPRLFLPLEAFSDYGNAKLVRNEIIGDRRIIGLEAEGNFPVSGTALSVKGIPGLAETDTSMLDILASSDFWGKAATVSLQSGVLRIINDCVDRRFLHNSTIDILSINPNPAESTVNLTYRAENVDGTSIHLFDELGTQVFISHQNDISAGTYDLQLDVSSLPIGTYRLVVRSDSVQDSHIIIIYR